MEMTHGGEREYGKPTYYLVKGRHTVRRRQLSQPEDRKQGKKKEQQQHPVSEMSKHTGPEGLTVPVSQIIGSSDADAEAVQTLPTYPLLASGHWSGPEGDKQTSRLKFVSRPRPAAWSDYGCPASILPCFVARQPNR